MTEKPTKPPKAPTGWRGKPRHGDMASIRYPDTPGKRLGNWLFGLLTPWKR